MHTAEWCRSTCSQGAIGKVIGETTGDMRHAVKLAISSETDTENRRPAVIGTARTVCEDRNQHAACNYGTCKLSSDSLL